MTKLSNVTEQAVVRKSNFLIESPQKLSIPEARFLAMVLSRFDWNQSGFSIITFALSDVFECLSLKTTNNRYNIVKAMSKNLLSRVVTIHEETGKERQAHWIESCLYDLKTGTVTVRISEEMAPYLLKLSGFFTVYRLKYYLIFSSFYTMRLYELLMQTQNFAKLSSGKEKKPLGDGKSTPLFTWYRSITAKELKAQLAVQEGSAYDKWSNFVSRILDPSTKEITKKSPYRVNWNKSKCRGRIVEEITFVVEQYAENEDLVLVQQEHLDPQEVKRQEEEELERAHIKYSTLTEKQKETLEPYIVLTKNLNPYLTGSAFEEKFISLNVWAILQV